MSGSGGTSPRSREPVWKVMPMADAPDTIMNLDDLAAYVKLSKSSLYKLCQAGKVPGTKIGRTWRFHKDVIDTWIKTGVPPTQAYGTARAKTKKSRKK